MNLLNQQEPRASGNDNSILQVLDRIDRNEWVDRAGLILFMLAATGFVLWIRLRLLSHLPVDPQGVYLYLRDLILGVTITLITFISLATTKLQIEIRRSSKSILRAIDEARKERTP